MFDFASDVFYVKICFNVYNSTFPQRLCFRVWKNWSGDENSNGHNY